MFTAHLDTVHKSDGHNPVVYDTEMEWMSKADGTPLGADDGAGVWLLYRMAEAGVWLLYRMAEAGVPGTYIFPVGEECGGVGAKWLAENAETFLGKFDRAIAFDRRGTSSVITHQAWGRCCSGVFAGELCGRLGAAIPNGYVFAPDDTGVYTDTAEFINDIAECTNISIGYDREHTGHETLDVGYLTSLLTACVAVDWETLPVVRDPAEIEPTLVGRWGGGMYKWYDDGFESTTRFDMLGGSPGLPDISKMTDEDIYEWVYSDPEGAAELLIASR